MQKTCNVAEMAFLAKKIGGKSKKLAEIYPPYPPLFACMGMLALFMKKKMRIPIIQKSLGRKWSPKIVNVNNKAKGTKRYSIGSRGIYGKVEQTRGSIK